MTTAPLYAIVKRPWGHRLTLRAPQQPGSGLDQRLQLTAGIGRGPHGESVKPDNAAVTEAVALPLTWAGIQS
jgi:hypothetical protein